MQRRQVLKTSIVAVPTVLAGCGTFSENPDEELTSASEHVQKAAQNLETQVNGFEQIGETASFDPQPVREELEAASEQLDRASEQASSKEAKNQVQALRALIEFLEALTSAFVDLAAAQQALNEGFTQYSSGAYQRATNSFESGNSRLEKSDGHYRKAQSALEDSDLSDVDIDVEKMKAKLRESSQYIDAYGVLIGGVVSFTRGMSDFDSGSSAFEDDSFGSAKASFDQASDHFVRAHDDLSLPEDAPDGLVDPISFLKKTATTLGELSTAMVALSKIMTSLQTVRSYLDASRYSDAISLLQSIQNEITNANNALDRARTALSSIEASQSISAIELEQTREDLDRGESALTALNFLVSGMIDFVEGTRAIEKGSTDAQNEQYSKAATHFETAANDFDDAYQDFQQGESNAPTSLKSTFVDSVCRSGAYRDGSSLYAEGYRAAADGNYDRANKKIEEGDKAYNRCG